MAPIVGQCLEGMEKAAQGIDERKVGGAEGGTFFWVVSELAPPQDTNLVVERYKSGFTPPSDLPFEDLSNHDTASVNGSTHSIQTR